MAESQKRPAKIRKGSVAKICGILCPAPDLFRREHEQEVCLGKLGMQIIENIPQRTHIGIGILGIIRANGRIFVPIVIGAPVYDNQIRIRSHILHDLCHAACQSHTGNRKVLHFCPCQFPQHLNIVTCGDRVPHNSDFFICPYPARRGCRGRSYIIGVHGFTYLAYPVLERMSLGIGVIGHIAVPANSTAIRGIPLLGTGRFGDVPFIAVLGYVLLTANIAGMVTVFIQMGTGRLFLGACMGDLLNHSQKLGSAPLLLCFVVEPVGVIAALFRHREVILPPQARYPQRLGLLEEVGHLFRCGFSVVHVLPTVGKTNLAHDYGNLGTF